jgi:nucleoprotein TPR
VEASIAMATATVDVGYLATYLNISQPTLDEVIGSPTAELVRAVLEAVTAKAHEHQELQADKLRVDVELENAIRTAETRTDGLKATVKKSLNEVNGLREKLTAEGMHQHC